MTILVTGGAGYIGSQTVKALKQAGHTVVVFDSLEKGHRQSLAALQPQEVVVGSTLNQDKLEAVFSRFPFEAVIHLAAYIEAGESVKNPGAFFRNNTSGAIYLLETMTRHGVSNLVFSSTAAVYGNPKSLPIPESADLVPTNPYGTSKLLVEEVIREMTKFTPLKATILRYFNASGADPGSERGEDHHPETHLIPLILRVALGQNEAIKVFGTDYPTPDGTAIRDYIHVSDLAAAHLLALEQRGAEPLAIYNVGTGRGYSVREIIEACRRVTGHPIPAQDEPRRPGDPEVLVADSQKIEEELGWQARHSELETIVSTAWRWHQANPEGYRR